MIRYLLTFLVIVYTHCSSVDISSPTFYCLQTEKVDESSSWISFISANFTNTNDNLATSYVTSFNLLIFKFISNLNFKTIEDFDYTALINMLTNEAGTSNVEATRLYSYNELNNLQLRSQSFDSNLSMFSWLKLIENDPLKAKKPYFQIHYNTELLSDSNVNEDGTIKTLSSENSKSHVLTVFFQFMQQTKDEIEKKSFKLQINSIELETKTSTFCFNSNEQSFKDNSIVKFIQSFGKDKEEFKKKYNYNNTDRLLFINELTEKIISDSTFNDFNCMNRIYNKGSSCEVTTKENKTYEMAKINVKLNMVEASTIGKVIFNTIETTKENIIESILNSKIIEGDEMKDWRFVVLIMLSILILIAFGIFIYFTKKRNRYVKIIKRKKKSKMK
eukprot:GAHX01001204.1.p1 GENE.GAHX01001204.1~~GAHX01001204.1.p1  ORF type:complete len:411 (-),score=74.78 GAHX01001204.1:60-1226(-)